MGGIGLLVLLGVLFPQEAQKATVQRNWAACQDLEVWQAQEDILHDAEGEWFEFMRPHILEGGCRLTRLEYPILVLDSLEMEDGHTALLVVLEGIEGEWWLSPEALDP
jgi:hypothetical protein